MVREQMEREEEPGGEARHRRGRGRRPHLCQDGRPPELGQEKLFSPKRIKPETPLRQPWSSPSRPVRTAVIEEKMKVAPSLPSSSSSSPTTGMRSRLRMEPAAPDQGRPSRVRKSWARVQSGGPSKGSSGQKTWGYEQMAGIASANLNFCRAPENVTTHTHARTKSQRKLLL